MVEGPQGVDAGPTFDSRLVTGITRRRSLAAELHRRPTRWQFWALVGVGVALLAGGLAYALTRIEQNQRDQLARQFAGRTQFAARTTGGLIASTNSQGVALAAQQLGGSRPQLAAQLKAYQQGGPANEPSLIFGSGGRLLAPTTPVVPTAAFEAIAADAKVAWIGSSGRMSDEFVGPGGVPMFAVLLPFETRFGRRVLVNAGPLDIIKGFAQGYLASGPGVAGSRAYLVDGHGVVLADGAGKLAAVVLPDRRLLRAAVSRGQGTVGGLHYAAAPVANGGDWRVIFTAPARLLFAPVNGSFTAAWILFGVVVAAVAVALSLGARTISRSAQLARKAGELAQAEERARSAEQLAHERLHDELTGLPNRNLFLDRAELAIAAQRTTDAPLAVLFLDVDRFKRVNDSLGHALGDELLKTISTRLARVLRPTDTLSRATGDEFLVLRPVIRNEREALILARQLETAVEAPIELEERRIRVTATIGVVVRNAGDPPAAASELVRNADAALQRARAVPGTRAHVFDTGSPQLAAQRLDTEIGLSAAVANGELILHYQPIVELPGGGIRGAEALVRWQRPGFGMVPPLDFIQIAEESGLIVEIGKWVLDSACVAVASWREAGLVASDFVLSVNVSPRQLMAPGLRDTVASALRESGLPPERLCLEITESAIMEDESLAIAALEALRTLGVIVAMDDFGIGQTSLGRIRRLPIDEVKIDRSFISGETGLDTAIVPTISVLARSLHLTAVAEGVETQDVAEQLAAFGYRLAQGFHFGRPEDEATFTNRLRALGGATLAPVA